MSRLPLVVNFDSETRLDFPGPIVLAFRKTQVYNKPITQGIEGRNVQLNPGWCLLLTHLLFLEKVTMK